MMRKSFFISCVVTLTLVFSANSYADAKSLGSKLYEAALVQDLPELQSLISKGADVNYLENGRPILGWAAQNGNVEVVNALLKAGANPNLADTGVGHTPLMRAIDTQQVEITRALLKAKADPNAKSKSGESCLTLALQSHKPEVVKMLIEAGVNVKEVSEDGYSPMLAASEYASPESYEIIKMLAAAKAPMDVSNAAYTPLVYAVQQGNKDLVKVLLDAGANPNAPTSTGQLPLQNALDNPEILKMLLTAKADVKAKVRGEGSILGQAIDSGLPEAAKTLIEAGAGESSDIDTAKRNGLSEIVVLLESKFGNGKNPVIPISEVDTAPSVDFNPNSDACTVVDAARKQMNLHGRLQKQVDAGKKSDDIFRTFNVDIEEFSKLLTENPPEACKLLDRLAAKYGVTWKD